MGMSSCSTHGLVQGVRVRLGLPRNRGPGANTKKWESLSPDLASELGRRFCPFVSPLDSTHRRCPINVALNEGRAF